jgi:hypothetical protein
MGGQKEPAELAAFERFFAKTLEEALMAGIRKAEAEGVDVRTWLARGRTTEP